MPPERHGRTGKSYARALDLPPPFRLETLREAGDAFAHARANAATLGAGTLVFVGRFDLAEFAVVLEPDEKLAASRRAFYVGMVALADALAGLAPPEKPIDIAWPDAIHVDRGLVGGGRLAWPAGADEGEVPDWLVFGATVRTASMTNEEAGLHPLATALADEGFGELGAERIAEGFARHLMIATDRWQERGFAPIAADYLAKLQSGLGGRSALDASGDLLIRRADRTVERRSLAASLKMPSWLDPKTGGPRL